jgi:hypothetical protein
MKKGEKTRDENDFSSLLHPRYCRFDSYVCPEFSSKSKFSSYYFEEVPFHPR